MFDLSTDLFGSRSLPVASLAAGFCAVRRGLSPALLHDDSQRSFELQEETRRHFDFDSHPFYLHATYGTWEHATNSPSPSSELRSEPTLPRYPIRCRQDLEALVLPDVTQAGMLPAAIRFSQLQQEAGKPVSVVLGGVFTLAASLGGIEKLFEWMIGEPDLAHGLLSASRQHLREVARHWSERFGAARLTPIIWEAVASGDLLSPRHFEEFVLPHQQQLNDEILSLGVAGLICHLCGDQSRQASLWAEVPMGERGIVSVGSEVDLRLASEALGHVAVMGNLDPELLRSGSTEHVRNATLDCIERGRRHPAGFILSPGCALQSDIPEANLRAMLRTARELLV